MFTISYIAPRTELDGTAQQYKTRPKYGKIVK